MGSRLPTSRTHPRRKAILAFVFAAIAAGSALADTAGSLHSPSLSYTNQRVAKVPWSIHVVRIPRTPATYELRSAHAGSSAIGMDMLSSQVRQVREPGGVPVAAVNGDFYQRSRAHAGDPRGLQIAAGELISAPNGGVAFWIDANGEPHASNVISRFVITWPAGSKIPKTPFDLNGDRAPEDFQLYTSAVGATTRTSGGREFILEPATNSSWKPFRIGTNYSARIVAIRDGGNSPIAPGTAVLSVGPAAARSLPALQSGALLELSTATFPSLAGAREAIGGGPALVRAGRKLKIVPPSSDSYESTSMLERHPRTAIGWNALEYILVVVDGRQDRLSVGMTLDELGETMARLGCSDAMNLDGGGSATLWYGGAVKNSPCDGRERPIANSLVVLSRPGKSTSVP